MNPSHKGSGIEGSLRRHKESARIVVLPAGFSLIEFIGVLAILAIVVSALVPVMVKRIDLAAWLREQTDLQSIMTNVATGITQTRTIPSGTSWAYLASSNLSISLANVTNTPRSVKRLYLVDNSGWLGTNGLTYPYVQTSAGFTRAKLARVLLVSSIDSKNGVPNLTQSDFQTTWQWNTALTATKPTTGTWAAWPGKGADVVIQRLNLEPLLHRVILVNRDVILNGNAGATVYYATDGSALVAITNNIIDSYFLDGSALALYTNSSSSSPQLTEIVKGDESRIFESGSWRDQIASGPPSASLTNIDSIAYAFVTSPSPPAGTGRGDNSFGVADLLVAYMNAYSSWSNMSPCFSNEGQSPGNQKKIPEMYLMCTAIGCFMGGTCQSGNGNVACQIVQ